MNNNEIRVGIIADAQYADCPPDPAVNRYYPLALDRLADAVTTFDEHGVDLILNLGDLIDRDWKNLTPALNVLATAKAPVFHVPGNHDFAVDPDHLPEVRTRLAPSGGNFPHRHQVAEGLRLLVLDSAAVSLYAATQGTPSHLEASGWLSELSRAGKPNAKSYNGGLGDDQRHWLHRELSEAKGLGERVIIACHQPVYGGNEKFHLWDAKEVNEILARSPGVVIAWLAGHSHAALHTQANGTLHWQAAAMVDSPDQSAYAEMLIGIGEIRIKGFGRQPSLPSD